MTQQRLRQFTVVALVLGVHLLFVAVVSWGRRSAPPDAEPEAMILLDLTQPVEVPKTPPHRDSRTPARTDTTKLPQTQRVEAPAAAITPEVQQAPIDWDLAGRSAVEAQAQEGIRKQRQECEEAARKHNEYPRGCPRDSYDPHWEPEEKKAGFKGIIPYVRLGKRCIVGLGFFGCNLDPELPQPRGTLLNDMTDPSRPTSSVPELDNGAPEAPRPQAFKPQ